MGSDLEWVLSGRVWLAKKKNGGGQDANERCVRRRDGALILYRQLTPMRRAARSMAIASHEKSKFREVRGVTTIV